MQHGSTLDCLNEGEVAAFGPSTMACSRSGIVTEQIIAFNDRLKSASAGRVCRAEAAFADDHLDAEWIVLNIKSHLTTSPSSPHCDFHPPCMVLRSHRTSKWC